MIRYNNLLITIFSCKIGKIFLIFTNILPHRVYVINIKETQLFRACKMVSYYSKQKIFRQRICNWYWIPKPLNILSVGKKISLTTTRKSDDGILYRIHDMLPVFTGCNFFPYKLAQYVYIEMQRIIKFHVIKTSI